MRVRWQFFFMYEALKFERTYAYEVLITKEHAEAFGLTAQEFEANVTIEADEEEHGSITQRGKINITLPGDNKQTKDLAYSLAINLAEHITFSLGRIKLDGSFIWNELLPETPEEAAEVGGNRFSWRMRIKEVPPKVPFDRVSLQRLTNNPLIKQFNEANNAQSPVDRFIGLFKILEDLYGGHPLKASFKGSTELKQIAMQQLRFNESGATRQMTQADFEQLIDELVDTRHECAHLRRSTGFGITYGDARVQSQVEPLIPALEKLAYEAVQKRIV
jgi:hypothetical protein